MFCIAAFIVFAVLGIFSASYRPLVKQAWHCVVRRVTFKPCDINFGEEVKGRLLGKIVIRHPHVAKFLSKWIDWLSFAFVALSIWSVVYVFNAGLNLWVYDTCNPSSVESCTLSGEACGVDQASTGFWQSAVELKLGTWTVTHVTQFVQTLSRIPDRLRTWDAKEFYGPTATTYFPWDAEKPYALEVMDPSCKFCRKLFLNIQAVGFEQTHNLSYLLYPIPLGNTGATKFPHSTLLASYVEAVKKVPIQKNTKGVSPDWQLIERIFGERPDGTDWQTYFNMGATQSDVRSTVRGFLSQMGYSQAQIVSIEKLVSSPEVAASLAAQRDIVENKLHTIKIPTFLFGGHRYDRVVNKDILQAK